MLTLLLFFRHTYSSVRTTTKQSHRSLTLRQHQKSQERKSTLGLKNKLRVSWAQPQHLCCPTKSICHFLWAGALAGAARSCLLMWRWSVMWWEDRERAAHLSSFKHLIWTSVICLRRFPLTPGAVLYSCWSSGRAVSWCCTQAPLAEQTEGRDTSAYPHAPGQRGVPALLCHLALGKGAPPSTWCNQPLRLSASSCLP